MNVNKLTDEALDELIDDIAKGLKEVDRELKVETLVDLVAILDYFDEEDSFGTEGWKHTFGVED